MSSIADGRTGVRLLRWYNTLTVSSPIHGHHFKIRSGFPHLMAVISDSHCLCGFVTTVTEDPQCIPLFALFAGCHLKFAMSFRL
jgi:hypothetical protein